MDALALAVTRTPTVARPAFRVAQVKGVGGSTVIEWDVHVPECDEYPTAEIAFSASLHFAGRYQAAFAPADKLMDELQASVAAPDGAK